MVAKIIHYVCLGRLSGLAVVWHEVFVSNTMVKQLSVTKPKQGNGCEENCVEGVVGTL